METELVRAAGVVAALALAVLVAAPWRLVRLAGLAVWGGGAVVLALELGPDLRAPLLAAAVVGAALGSAVLGALFVRWPWLLPLAALACVPVRVPIDVGGEEANLLLPLYAVVGGAAAALAWRLARGGAGRQELGALTWPVAALVAWFGLSLLWTGDLREGAVALAAFYLPFGLLALALARLPWSRRWLLALGVQLGLMALVFAGVGIYQWATRDVFWNPKVIVGNAYAPFYRVNSVFWDPSIYGRFLVVAVLAGLVVVLARAGLRASVAVTAGIAVAWFGLVLSFSQSSFAALIVVVLAAAAVAWGRRTVLALTAVAVLLVSVGFTAPQVRRELQRDLDRATSGRAGLVENGARIALDHPVAGVGLGGFKRAYADRVGLRGEEPRRAASHNTPVTVAAETGFPGLALLGWLLVVGVVRPLGGGSRGFVAAASLIVALSVGAIAVHSLFYNAFFEDPMAWGALGLGAFLARRREGPVA